ncbi:FAD/NAD P-binding domain-containing protein [Gloeophyllum trabeum ATCC 11539]|uniref:FAD/NAD P-binding domain-containing protein n=1 Tax=Gloeophyllum trabeum (strain ATCC 11539 / FP-39264 / Madison 617) TaxID=670483 RepID=S7Q8P1_GLOTA|nr:FAD/NAD P-binding domain-containing protein [Gloeophyllum trabeum ATCC 11539]EPQ56351.1 FAD/NAD P-binding domain-containing protein [Gloeophyllum trabeum ATCC 11539]
MTTETNGTNAPKNGASSLNGTSGHPNGYKLGDFSIDECRPMRVVCIGAGFSGILAGIRFPQKVPNVDLTIYDKNPAIGGTWYNNKYPGLSCDIPAHTYQYAFEDNMEWSAFYAPGPEIREYLERVANKYKVMKYIHLEHELVGAYWQEAESKWRLRVKRPSPNSTPENKQYEEFEDKADVLFTGLGSLARWHWPDIEGLKDFKGCILHSAEWDVTERSWQESVKDWGDKKVGVIGVGSSAIQIVPALQPRVAHLVNFVRSKTWLATPFLEEKMSDLLGRDPAGSYVFTEEDKQRFRDPAFYKKFRHNMEHELNSTYQGTLKGTKVQQMIRAAFTENMRQRLAKKPWITEYLLPDFGVACRRLTPGPGYLEALCEDNVTFEPTHIRRITETGIELVDGKHHDLDIIVCATGFDTSFQYPFPFVGRGGITLREKYTPHPRTYLALCVDGFPNWFQSCGPNSGVYGGSLVAILQQQVDYAVKATLKLQRERLKSMVVKKEAVDDFDEYLEAYFPKTVHTEKCRSWAKMGKDEGRVVGLWPGSSLHCLRAFAHPRWEDFDYQPLDPVKNRFYWLGDGQTYNEKTLTGDRAWYLNPDEVDYPPVPEN